jgi:hypothetical protein
MTLKDKTSRGVLIRSSSISNFETMLNAAGLTPHRDHGPSVVAAIFDEVSTLSELETFAASHPTTPIILVTSGLERPDLAACVSLPTLLSVSLRGRSEELLEALALVSDGQGTSLRGRWLPQSAFSREVGSSVERDRLLEEVEAYLSDEGVRSRYVNLARDAIEELVTNALYDAPADSTGRRIYLETDRRNAIFLPPAARPQLDLGVIDGRIVAVMTDPHGSLELETVRRFLAAGLAGEISDKPGGAGLGFARVFGLVDRLGVQISPKVRTEIGFILETRRDSLQGKKHTGLLVARV